MTHNLIVSLTMLLIVVWLFNVYFKPQRLRELKKSRRVEARRNINQIFDQIKQL